MEQDVISMEIVNPHAAGIDVGSRSHWAAVGQSEQDVREYGVFNEDLFALADWRDQRRGLIRSSASTSKKMQMNLRLDVVVKDVCGLTGLAIIQAICDGQNDPRKLASLRHGNCKKSEEEIAKALHSNSREDYLFALKQELDAYRYLQDKIVECDLEI